MSTFRSKLARCDTSSYQQIIPVPVVSIYGLSLVAPRPLCSLILSSVLECDPIILPAIVPIQIEQYPSNSIILPGAIVANVTGVVPPIFLRCDGSIVSRTTYAMLFNIIGTYYGEGDGISTFHLPNLSNDSNPHIIYMIKYDAS